MLARKIKRKKEREGMITWIGGEGRGEGGREGGKGREGEGGEVKEKASISLGIGSW